MGQYYQDLDRRRFDYDLQRVAGLRGRRYRGPAVDLSRPYMVCIGAAQTFGRFVDRPFPRLLAERLGIQVLNLGVGGAGPRVFDTPDHLAVINGARLAVVQVLSGRSAGNSLFDNSTTGDHRGIRVADGEQMRFEEFLRELVDSGPTNLVRRAVRETRSEYVAGYKSLFEHIRVPTVLLWWSSRAPAYVDDYSSARGLLREFPQLVNLATLNEMRRYSGALLECTSSLGIPQELPDFDEAIEGTKLENGKVVNRYYPSPQMHAEVAERLEPLCRPYLPDHPSGLPGEAPFVLVATERTGSTLLLQMLNSHPSVAAGGELFNANLIDQGRIVWPNHGTLEDSALLELRNTNPIEFIHRLFDEAVQAGHRAVGFKLMYGHGDGNDVVRDYLAHDTNLRVIHLKRRNLLRRQLSNDRARATGVWHAPVGTPRDPPPAVEIDLERCVTEFIRTQRKQAEYERRFAGHALLELHYEDLAADPVAVAGQALAFLGLEASPELSAQFERIGVDRLRDAIVNYDELKAHFRRWASFFEE